MIMNQPLIQNTTYCNVLARAFELSATKHRVRDEELEELEEVPLPRPPRCCCCWPLLAHSTQPLQPAHSSLLTPATVYYTIGRRVVSLAGVSVWFIWLKSACLLDSRVTFSWFMTQTWWKPLSGAVSPARRGVVKARWPTFLSNAS